MSRRLKRYFNSRAHVERDSFSRWYSPHPVTFQLTRSRGARLVIETRPQPKPYFNSRAHVERDQQKPERKIKMKNFNSRAHVERDLWFSVMPGSAGKFQLTRSRGARLTAAEHWREDCVFQLTRSRGARHGSDRIAISVASFQLTRSRGARLPHGSDLRMEYDTISTHALTWSATFNPAGRWSMLCISTHALTWSATRCL